MLEPCQSSDVQSASAAIIARPAALHSVTVLPAAATSTVIIYDNATTNSGTILAKITALANAKSETIIFTHPIVANKGLYAALSGAAANYLLHYSVL